MPHTSHIIACSVFKDAVSHLADRMAGRPLSYAYLPSHLHLKPTDLKARLLTSIRQAKEGGASVACLYGQCFPDIDRCLDPEQVARIPCGHCYEAFLGRRRYRQIMAARPGTFFVEKELLLDFDALCRIPLELDDPAMREIYFSHYQQVVYIRQPLDPDLSEQTRFVADLLKLQRRTVDADYTELKRFLQRLC